MNFGLLAVIFAKISMLVQPSPIEINSTEVNSLHVLNNPVYAKTNMELANLPAAINQMSDFKEQTHVLSREKRLAKGGGGGGHSSGRSYRGWTSYRSSYRSNVNNRPAYRTSKNYFTGKKWYNLNGKSVNLYKSLLYTQSGKIKQFITTTKGIKYKINKVNNWLNIKTKDQFTISTLPKTVQYKYNNNLFKLGVCNFYFNYLWNNPLKMHLLYHKNNQPLKLLFMPDHEDESMINIGYYNNNEEINSPTNTTKASNQTLTVANKGNTFVKLASIPKGGDISFAILNKLSSNQPHPTVNPATINNTQMENNTTSIPEYNITSLFYNFNNTYTNKITPLPIIINPNNTDLNHTLKIIPLQKSLFNSTMAYNANNITQINSLLLLAQQNITDTASQLIIMSDNKIISTLSFPQKVDEFLISSNNDTILTYSMNDPRIEKIKLNNNNHNRQTPNSATTIRQNINYLLLSTLCLLGIKNIN